MDLKRTSSPCFVSAKCLPVPWSGGTCRLIQHGCIDTNWKPPLVVTRAASIRFIGLVMSWSVAAMIWLWSCGGPNLKNRSRLFRRFQRFTGITFLMLISQARSRSSLVVLMDLFARHNWMVGKNDSSEMEIISFLNLWLSRWIFFHSAGIRCFWWPLVMAISVTLTSGPPLTGWPWTVTGLAWWGWPSTPTARGWLWEATILFFGSTIFESCPWSQNSPVLPWSPHQLFPCIPPLRCWRNIRKASPFPIFFPVTLTFRSRAFAGTLDDCWRTIVGETSNFLTLRKEKLWRCLTTVCPPAACTSIPYGLTRVASTNKLVPRRFDSFAMEQQWLLGATVDISTFGPRNLGLAILWDKRWESPRLEFCFIILYNLLDIFMDL